MPKHIEKYGKYLCPSCGKELDIKTISYDKITDGIFRSGKTIMQTEETCSNCGWSYIEKEEE